MGLPEKLREQAHHWSTGGTESKEVADNYRDAADEIELLRIQLASEIKRHNQTLRRWEK